jgi:hypothetical protein
VLLRPAGNKRAGPRALSLRDRAKGGLVPTELKGTRKALWTSEQPAAASLSKQLLGYTSHLSPFVLP